MIVNEQNPVRVAAVAEHGQRAMETHERVDSQHGLQAWCVAPW